MENKTTNKKDIIRRENIKKQSKNLTKQEQIQNQRQRLEYIFSQRRKLKAKFKGNMQKQNKSKSKIFLKSAEKAKALRKVHTWGD